MRNNKQKGFSLVEVIVAAVIIAVLAAVAVPVYLTYIENQRQANVEDLAKTGAASANSFFRRTNTDPTVDDLNLFLPDSSRYTVTVSSGSVTITDNEHSGVTHTVTYK
ncbi:MAG: prepilin-type N-terminal cleavage/methylation domain-containing protein [Fibrobacteria bacterium]|nr:prepilin-type N-terminal cleavage/methylation domain-containing protein [Fibrobacteria bacterium]